MTVGKAENKTKDEGYGPSWYDAWEYARAIEKNLGEKIAIRMMPAEGKQRQFGWRVCACLESNPNIAGYGSFGSAFPGNGQRSFAASVYRALLALDEQCAIRWATPEEVTQAALALDSEP